MTATSQPTPPASGAMETLCQEHAVVLRMWGRLQNELSQQVRRQLAERAQWHTEVMRLRASLMLTRTAVLWGMGLGSPLPPPRPAPHTRRPATPGHTNRTAADEVLCQTACVGHAHHWLNDNLACTRTGQTCHRIAQND